MATVSRGEITITNVDDGKPSYTHWAYAWSADGTDRFTTVYPRENLFLVKEWEKLPPRPYLGYISRLEIQLEPNTNYTLSTNIPNLADNTTCDLFFLDSRAEPASRINGVAINKPRTIKTLADGIIIVGCRKQEFSSGAFWAKLEKGNAPTIYTPAPSEDYTNAYPTYAGTYTDYEPTDSEDPSKYTWQRILGESGQDGIAGKDGVGVSDTNITYAQSTSGTTPPSTGWTEQVPTLVKGQYLWTKTVWTYTDNSTETGYTVSYNAKDGNDGTDGKAGKDGVGIASTKVEYVGSTSGTVKPTTGWSTTIPTVAEGSFLWTRTTWTYTDSTSEVGYSVAKMGETGAKGDKGDSATSYWITPSVNTIQISATKVLNPTTITFTGYSKTGTANAGLYAGRFNILTSVDGIVYSSKYSSSANQSAYTYTVPADVKFIKARMYQAGGVTVLVDEVTIPIIESAEGLEIGGRNLLTRSAEADRTDYNTNNGTTVPITKTNMTEGTRNFVRIQRSNPTGSTSSISLFNSIQWSKLSEDIREKGAVTVSFLARAQTDVEMSLMAYSYAPTLAIPSHGSTVQLTNQWKRYSVTFDNIPSTAQTGLRVALFQNRTTIDNSTFYIDTCEYMVEYATKPSNWTPAPEDAVTYQRWSNDPNGLVDMTDTYPNENLFVGSVSEYRTAGVGAWNGGMGFTSLLEDIGVKVGDSVTLSAYFKNPTTAPDSVSARINFVRADETYTNVSGNYIKPGEEGRSAVYGTIPTGTVGITCYIQRTGGTSTAPSFTTQIMKEKLEIGTQATIWTSNQQDDKLLAVPQYVGVGVQNTMNPSDFTWTINPEYTQARTDVGLDAKLDEETFNDAQDHLNEVIDGKADSQELQDLKDMADNLQQSYEGFVGEGGQHEADLQALEARVEGLIFELDEQVAAFDFVKTHMRLGEEGFEIAEEGSTMKMLLNNNTLSFIDGGKEVASFSNQKFIINQGAIVESLQVGSHKMSRLSDKVTVFQYAPKTTVTK